MNKLTMKQIAISFGERIGQDVEPSRLRLRGNWLFHKSIYRSDYEPMYKNEIDCYWAKNAQYDSGCISMEPWDGVHIDQSPFTPHNEQVVFETLKKLDKEYGDYIESIGGSYD